jgi:hypothetical protein
MNLTPIDPDRLPGILAGFARHFDGDPASAAALARIAATAGARPGDYDLPEHREAAVALVRAFGLEAIDEYPSQAFSWDGSAVRIRSEASVLIHEVAHWLLAPPERRALPDFGLGAGPETGRALDADAARCVGQAEKEEEELLSSLLGILWEAELGQPAIFSFVEQNWLEAWERPAAGEQFARTVRALRARGLIRADGRPVPAQARVSA